MAVNENDTLRTSQGLMVQSAGLVLNHWTDPIPRGFWIRDEQKKFYYVTRNYGNREAEDIYPPRTEARVLALVIKVSLVRAFTEGIDNVKSLTSVLVSIHVDVEEEESDTLYASIEDVVFVVPLNPDETDPLTSAICRECDTGLASVSAPLDDEMEESAIHQTETSERVNSRQRARDEESFVYPGQ